MKILILMEYFQPALEEKHPVNIPEGLSMQPGNAASGA